MATTNSRTDDGSSPASRGRQAIIRRARAALDEVIALTPSEREDFEAAFRRRLETGSPAGHCARAARAISSAIKELYAAHRDTKAGSDDAKRYWKGAGQLEEVLYNVLRRRADGTRRGQS
jgi:5'-deoxynucleotidase YfbR-like HD superfamily hydrolase